VSDIDSCAILIAIVFEIQFEESTFDSATEAAVRQHLTQVLGDLKCPAHGRPLDGARLLGQSADAMELRILSCCESLRDAAMRALGLTDDRDAPGAAPSPTHISRSSSRLPKVTASSPARTARISDEWEITTVSALATAIAELFSKRSVNGRPYDPPLHTSAIREATKASDADLIAAIRELEELGWLVTRPVQGALPFGFNIVEPTARLFERVDRLVKGWDANADAIRVAAELIKAGQRRLEAHVLAARLDWKPRRLNPALSYLLMHDLAASSGGNVDRVFVTAYVSANARTRRFCTRRSGTFIQPV
jgi:hypothetical protein